MLQDVLDAMRAGDTAAAAAALDRALEADPDRADLLTLRASLDLGAGDLARAQSGFGAALALDPNQLPAYIALAHLALARGDRAEAERHLAYARRVDEDHPRLRVLEARLAAADGRGAEAVALLSRAGQRAPEDPLVQAALGLGLLDQRHYAFAEQALRNALSLSNAAPALRGALIAALESQQRVDEALAEADAWVGATPGAAALWARARLRTATNDGAGALADLAALRVHAPRHEAAFELELKLLDRLHGPEAVVAALEQRVAADPGFVPAWRWILGLALPGQIPHVIARWREAAPDDAHALEAAALLAEREGLEGEALALAEEALQRDPTLLEASLLRARASAFLPPDTAVSRMEALHAAAPTGAQKRALEGWRGVALHRAGRAADALDCWRRMWTGGPRFGLPLPNPHGAEAARPAADGGAGLLLWGPPGSRIDRVNALLGMAPRPRLLLDRWQAGRGDGFDALRVGPDDARAGTAAQWRARLEGAGLDPAHVIDALPHWDGWTHATLHGTRLVVALRDPRDLLVNWLAWGSASGFAFPAPNVAAAWLERVLEQLLAAEAAALGRVLRLDTDLADRDPAAYGARLATLFDLSEAPDAGTIAALGLGPNGQPTDFAAGSWRAYAEPLKGLFGPLGQLAVRLGYPAD